MNSTNDWYTSVPITDGIESIEVTVGSQSRVFTIDAEPTRVVIDTGRWIGDLRSYLDATYGDPVRLYLTHSHWDHVGNAYQFDSASIHPEERNPDGSLTLDVLSPVFLERPSQFVAGHLDQQLPFPDGFDPETFTVPPVDHVDTHEGGDTIELDDRTLEVLDLPGHSRGQTGFLDRDSGVLFGADIVHRDGNAYVHFADSSLDAYLSSLERLIALRVDGAFDTLLTAHNPPFMGDDLDVIERLRDVLAAVRDGEHEYDLIDTPWGRAREHVVDDARILTKPMPS